MLDFLSSITDSIGTLLSFLGNFLSSLLSFFSFAVTGVNALTNFVFYLPEFLFMFAVLGLMITFVLNVLGR